MRLTLRVLMFILIINITFLIMVFNKFMGIAIFIFLLILILLTRKLVIENFSNSENSKINKILYDDTTQKIIDKLIKKDECLNFKKFKYIIDNVIDNVSIVPMSKTIIKLFVTDDEIKSIFNNFLKNKSNRGNNNPNKLCRSEVEDLLRIYIKLIVNKMK
jgi:hypothetical protein